MKNNSLTIFTILVKNVILTIIVIIMIFILATAALVKWVSQTTVPFLPLLLFPTQLLPNLHYAATNLVLLR